MVFPVFQHARSFTTRVDEHDVRRVLRFSQKQSELEAHAAGGKRHVNEAEGGSGGVVQIVRILS